MTTITFLKNLAVRSAFILLTVVGGASVAHAATGDISAVRLSTAPYKDAWVAEVDIEGLTSGGTFNMGFGKANDPSTAKIVFTVTSPGFDANGEATTTTRTVYGTKFLRQAYPNDAFADTTTSGNTLTVRVALSDNIYNADSNITANIAAGFYTSGTSNSAVSNIAVANTSTLDYPKVIGRWAWPGYERVTGDFLVEATAFQKFAKDGKPLSAMRFTATDQHGNSTTQVVSEMTKSTRTGDANTVLVYAATIPTATLTQGDKIEVNFIGYPWVGVASSTLNSSVTADGFAQPNERLGPLTNVLDKTGAYGVAYVLVDPLGKTGTSTGAVIYTSQAAAEAGGSATAFTNIRSAWNALRTYNTANFGRSNAGGGVILLNEGTYNFLSGTIPVGTTMDTWVIVKPASTATKANTILNGSGTPNFNFSGLIKLDGVSVVSTTTVMRDINGLISVWLHNSTINSTGVQPFIGNKVFYATQNQVNNLAGGGFWGSYSTSKGPAALVRGNNSTKIIYTHQYATLGNKNVVTGPTSAGFVEIGNVSGNQPSNNSIYAFNSAYNLNTVGVYAMGKDMANVAVVQNVLESQNAVSPLVQLAADSSTGEFDNVLYWNNTTAGQRESFAFNEYGTTSFPRYNWSIRNNAMQLGGAKTDVFAAGPPNGARIANWSAINMVGGSNNISQSTNTFLFEFGGLSAMYGIGNSSSTPLWVSDNSRLGTGTGYGNYNLVPTTLAIDLATSSDTSLQTLPFDFNGNSIYGAVDVGAYEYIPTLTMGVDQINASTTVRVYGDGKFRIKGTVGDSATANLSVQIPGSKTTDWLDAKVLTWENTGTRNKVWTESTADKSVGNTVHSVGDLTPNTSYRVMVNGVLATTTISGCASEVCTADGNGRISFTYVGGYSAPVTFDVLETTSTVVTTPPSVTITPSISFVLSGQISDNGTASTTVRGFNYGTTTAYGLVTSSNGPFQEQTFTQVIDGLLPNTTYHAQAFAISSAGTGLSPDFTFTTGSY